jgi:hypothetical protein
LTIREYPYTITIVLFDNIDSNNLRGVNMEIIEKYYSYELEKEVTVVLTWYDFDVATLYLDFEWEVQDETGKDVQDDLSGEEQDECERIARKYAKSL